jgi:hypothetical protein
MSSSTLPSEPQPPQRGEGLGESRRGQGARGLVKRVLLGIALVIYTVLFSEAYFRLIDPQPLMPRYVTGAPWGVRGNIPNARYWNHTAETDVEFRINGQGLRADRNYPFAKPPGTCRVALFGDSFFFGVETDLKDSIAGQLETRLNQEGFRAEVLNFAVGGFGTAEMLQTFEGFGRRFDPDVVIFSWDSSDLQDNVRSGLYRLEDGRLERAHDAYLPGVKTSNWLMRFGLYRAIADHSELYAFAREKAEMLIKNRLRSADKQSSSPPPEPANADDDAAEEISNLQEKRRSVDLSAALLLRAREEANASGADFYLVEIPFKLSRTRFRTALDVLPAEVRSQLNLVYTWSALGRAARPDLELFYESGQGHLTPVGVSILVNETVEHLAGSPQLRACASDARRSGGIAHVE